MPIKTWFRGYVLAAVVIIIGMLLLANIFLIYQNSLIIKRNKDIQEEAERVKVNTLDITRNIHMLDMVVRSYALVKKDRFFNAFDSAYSDRLKIFSRLEASLLIQKFPMTEFYALRDSVKNYFDVAEQMKQYLIHDERDKFLVKLDEDPGYIVWLQHQGFSKQVNAFENNISREAKAQYERALRDSYLLQIILFLLTMPTLAYSAYYASQALRNSEKLRRAEEQNNEILSRQNVRLEELVKERTHEIAAQNEEIVAHNEQLISQQDEIENQRNILSEQNEQLREAKELIEKQSAIIHQKNEELVIEVKKQTQDLKTTNLELIEQNNRLEQFAYIISHNLRAPMARIIGLADIFEYADGRFEEEQIIKMMLNSTIELDTVIKDLARILEIQKLNTQVLSLVDIKDILTKTTTILKREIDDTNTIINTDFIGATSFNSLPPYLESIFYNLIGNAIKYRQPGLNPVIKISSSIEEGYIRIEISDNGLGIDLGKYREQLFLLYKRFHFHVEGKGMGLYLVKTQVSALGGKITIQSKINEGTTFTLFFKI